MFDSFSQLAYLVLFIQNINLKELLQVIYIHIIIN